MSEEILKEEEKPIGFEMAEKIEKLEKKLSNWSDEDGDDDAYYEAECELEEVEEETIYDLGSDIWDLIKEKVDKRIWEDSYLIMDILEHVV